MHIVWIVLYCLIAAVILFGLTFHNEMLDERPRKKKAVQGLIVIDGGKAKSRLRA